MGEPHLPRVNLPDTVPRKPLVPGQNSWAQQQQQHEARQRNSTGDSTDDTRAINRDKYENKPMPPTPPADEGLSPGSSLLQPKAYIQPAIPLFPPPFRAPTPKMRAVTDPVPPKPLFASRKVSVKQLRKKYSQTKGKDETSNEGLLDDNQPSPTIPVASEKAAQVLGISSAPDNGRKTPRTSAPTMSAPAAFRTSNEGSQEQTVPPTRQVQSSPVPERSTPVPTRRYLKENGLQAPAPTEAANASKQVASEPEQSEVGLFDRANATKSQNTFLHPARIGTHMNVGEVGLVEGAGMHRVESFRGVIEDVPSSTSSNGQMYTNSYATSSQPSTGRDHGPRDPLPPNAYSPSNYGGVWENDPAVGHTLPPFTPMPKNRSSSGDIASHYNSPLAQPYFGPGQHTARGPQPPTNRSSNYQAPLPSANSWASNRSYGNSFTSPSAPPSALLPPRWPQYQNINSVPSPPQNQQDFERAGSLNAALAQIDLTLHHHLDSTFGSLSRLITDKHDRVIDQTIRRLENVEEALNKGFRTLKSDIRDIRKSVGNLQIDVKDIKTQHSCTAEIVQGIDAKLQALEKQLEEHACKCYRNPIEQSGSEPESDRPSRSEALSRTSHRRTESAHPTVGQAEATQPYHTGAGRPTNSARMSGASSRRDRSNTATSQPPPGRMSDERSNRREYFSELGAARGPVPDLRDHPAFADSQKVPEQHYGYAHSQPGMPVAMSGFPYENPSLSDGRWYQQAYGQHK